MFQGSQEQILEIMNFKKALIPRYNTLLQCLLKYSSVAQNVLSPYIITVLVIAFARC
jgi:hypothetical protein